MHRPKVCFVEDVESFGAKLHLSSVPQKVFALANTLGIRPTPSAFKARWSSRLAAI
jgi:hypothetical protein